MINYLIIIQFLFFVSQDQNTSNKILEENLSLEVYSGGVNITKQKRITQAQIRSLAINVKTTDKSSSAKYKFKKGFIKANGVKIAFGSIFPKLPPGKITGKFEIQVTKISKIDEGSEEDMDVELAWIVEGY